MFRRWRYCSVLWRQFLAWAQSLHDSARLSTWQRPEPKSVCSPSNLRMNKPPTALSTGDCYSQKCYYSRHNRKPQPLSEWQEEEVFSFENYASVVPSNWRSSKGLANYTWAAGTSGNSIRVAIIEIKEKLRKFTQSGKKFIFFKRFRGPPSLSDQGKEYEQTIKNA